MPAVRRTNDLDDARKPWLLISEDGRSYEFDTREEAEAAAADLTLTLPTILHEVTRLLGDIGCDHVTIARLGEGEHAYQVRFTPNKEAKRGYIIEGRRWIDQRPTIAEPSPTSARGTVGPYVGWSRWSAFMGFGVEAVLADDWRFLP